MEQPTRRPLPSKPVLIAGIVLSAGLAVGLAMLAKQALPTDQTGVQIPQATIQQAKANEPVQGEKLASSSTASQSPASTTDKPAASAAPQSAAQPGSKQAGTQQDVAQKDAANPAENALPAPVKLGDRIAKLDATTRTLNTLVIVEDARSYLDAIGAWTPTHRFPVLIDDGSVLATDNIARFVRSFGPKAIVRWKSAGAPVAFGAVTLADMREAQRGAWDAKDAQPATLRSALLDRGIVSPGIVVVNTDDTAPCGDEAWTAGVALAAARGQVLVGIPTKNAVNGAITVAEADELEKKLQAVAEASTWTWRGQGDDLEAITLASHTPGRIDLDGREFLATTDRLGRLEAGTTAPTRWAWCGQVFGNAPTAAYRAMCSIFTRPKTAFYFDGYEDKAPFNLYDCTKASEIARQNGMSIEVIDLPNNGAKDWRSRAARPFDAGLIFVTTHGNPSEFNLSPGQVWPGDLPLLGVPASAHFVHSFSAMFAGDRNTIAGRWLERGVHFYVGSVHEPFLGAFLPTSLLNSRMLSGAALGAAVRIEKPEVWKIAVIGDPLSTLLPPAPVVDDPLPLKDATAIDANLRDALVGKRYADGFRILALQGRDRDLAKFFVAAEGKEPATIDADAAKWAVLALARSGDAAGVVDAFAKLRKEDAQNGILRDALWLLSYPKFAKPSDAMLQQLRLNLRTESLGTDAAQLATAIERSKGIEASSAFLNELRATLQDKNQRDQLEAALKKR